MRSGVVEGARRREAIHLMLHRRDTAQPEGYLEDCRPALGGHSVLHRHLFARNRRPGVEHFVGPLLMVLPAAVPPEASFASALEGAYALEAF